MSQPLELKTREKILEAAIHLFAERGYDGVSVRDIAGSVGIKASSLYKHYENKEAILESIFSFFKAKIGQTLIPEEHLRQVLKRLSPEQYLENSFELFKQVMWSGDILKIAKVITIEQQRNGAIRQFFLEELIEKPRRNMKIVFDLMVENDTLEKQDTLVLAEEYTAYIIYLYFEQNFLKDGPDLKEIEARMKQHNHYFAKRILNKKGE